jgi:hypothetical protein
VSFDILIEIKEKEKKKKKRLFRFIKMMRRALKVGVP